MTTHVSDFEAAKSVADQLAGMDKERQERVLRWVAESLGLQHFSTGPVSTPNRGAIAPVVVADPRIAPGVQARAVGVSDIKSFVESKKPKTDVQFAAVVAYFYRFEAPPEERKEAIDSRGLQDAARLAGRRRPPDAKTTLNNAKKAGYLDSAGRGVFTINSVGENLVAMTLPGDGSSEPILLRRRNGGKKTASGRKQASKKKAKRPARKK